MEFEKIIQFDSKEIVLQQTKKLELSRDLKEKVYEITVKLKNDDNIVFELTEENYFQYIGHLAWYNGSIYIIYRYDNYDIWCPSYEDIKMYITTEADKT
jgi:hypothetical protein